MVSMGTVVFNSEVPRDKEEPFHRELNLLVDEMERRMAEYEDDRQNVHWRDDYAHHHIEKAMGELSMAYAETKAGRSPEIMRREVADAVNHLIMALDIGIGEFELNEKGRKVHDGSE